MFRKIRDRIKARKFKKILPFPDPSDEKDLLFRPPTIKEQLDTAPTLNARTALAVCEEEIRLTVAQKACEDTLDCEVDLKEYIAKNTVILTIVSPIPLVKKQQIQKWLTGGYSKGYKPSIVKILLKERHTKETLEDLIADD